MPEASSESLSTINVGPESRGSLLEKVGQVKTTLFAQTAVLKYIEPAGLSLEEAAVVKNYAVRVGEAAGKEFLLASPEKRGQLIAEQATKPGSEEKAKEQAAIGIMRYAEEVNSTPEERAVVEKYARKAVEIARQKFLSESPAGRFQLTLEQDEEFRQFLAETVNKYLPSIKALETMSPDLGDLGALQALAEQPPWELAARVLYKFAQELYTSKVKRFYGDKVVPLFSEGRCKRNCSEWVGNLMMKYGPKKATEIAQSLCLLFRGLEIREPDSEKITLRSEGLSDKDLQLVVETMVDRYQDLFQDILGPEAKKMYTSPQRVLGRFLAYGLYSLRKYFADGPNFSEWVDIAKALPERILAHPKTPAAEGLPSIKST